MTASEFYSLNVILYLVKNEKGYILSNFKGSQKYPIRNIGPKRARYPLFSQVQDVTLKDVQ